MLLLNRRRFLALAAAFTAACTTSRFRRAGTMADPAKSAAFTPVRLPHPLPIYTQRESFLAEPSPVVGSVATTGTRLAPSPDPYLARYEIVDDVIVPPEFERYVICAWGDRPFSDRDDYVGYNHDYTGFVPIEQTAPVSPQGARPSPPSERRWDGMLWINHEYISFPFHRLAPRTPSALTSAGTRDSFSEVIGFDLPGERDLRLMGEMHYNMGGSALRIRKAGSGNRFGVVADWRNRRLHGLSGLALNRYRSDQYRTVVAWGSRPHQVGNCDWLIGTGPAADDVFTGINADGLGNRIIGTFANCSGATTPWGTILSCEENFRHDLEGDEFLGVTEDVLPSGTQTGYRKGSSGHAFGLNGEKYGWVVEIDLARPASQPKKHTALGRMRHENVALRVRRGHPLVGYMGDDRRGGHVYKFVSSAVVDDPQSVRNSRLLEDGVLYAARLEPDGTGTWIPLVLGTSTNPNVPSILSARERSLRADGNADGKGVVLLPKRAGLAGQAENGGSIAVDLENEDDVLPSYRSKRLGDFYDTLGALLCDSFLAANLVGATPTARPEDIEIDPFTDHVFVAFTSADACADEGYPDSRIFTVGKYDAAPNAEQPFGGIYEIVEGSGYGAGTCFRWKRLVQAGEVGAHGAGFANVDNMTFDEVGNLWCATDMYVPPVAAAASGTPGVSYESPLSGADARELARVFGDNWMFVVAPERPDIIVPFCYGPPRSEFTGPTFVSDTLIVSVQHPGEDAPINDASAASVTTETVEMLDLEGNVVRQLRMTPRGSNWPANISGNAIGAPRPATIGIVASRARRAP